MISRYPYSWWLGLCFGLLGLVSCAPSAKTTDATAVSSMEHPAFSSDSAYRFIQHQLDLGARVPGTSAHAACVQYMVDQLEACGAKVEVQTGYKLDYAGQPCAIRNVIARFEGTSSEQGVLLLSSHFDSRPWCDQEQDTAYVNQPVPGANDGASGVGVLLEVARQIALSRTSQSARPMRPVEIVFFDAEDMGTPTFYQEGDRENTWCLGSQLWAEQVDSPERYEMGILLDMVGDAQAEFRQEYFSLRYANSVVQRVWATAEALGYGALFIPEMGGAITDDHIYVNRAGIPCIDIIDYRSGTTGFPVWWHTRNDNMNTINRHTLQAVGETVMQMIYTN